VYRKLIDKRKEKYSKYDIAIFEWNVAQSLTKYFNGYKSVESGLVDYMTATFGLINEEVFLDMIGFYPCGSCLKRVSCIKELPVIKIANSEPLQIINDFVVHNRVMGDATAQLAYHVITIKVCASLIRTFRVIDQNRKIREGFKSKTRRQEKMIDLIW
jgi:hypothetical protein